MEILPSGLWPQILIILAIVLLGGLFVLFELALDSARKGRLRSLAEGGGEAYRRALDAAEDPLFYLHACRIWIAVLRVLAGVLGGFLVRPLGDIPGGTAAGLRGDLAAAAAVILLLSLTVVILGTFVPRIIAAAAPEKVIAALLPAVRVFALPCRPLLGFYSLIDTLARRIFRMDSAGAAGMTEDELRGALAEGEKSGVVERNERTMVEGVFYLGDRPAGAFMTHRSELEWLDVNAGLQEIRALTKERGDQGCFPVAEGTLDNILGALYREDFLQALAEALPQDPEDRPGQECSPGLRPLIRKVPFIPETMSALKAFEAFRKGNTDYLFVMDEYGGFSGILSVRDLIEEIVGELAAGEDEEIRSQGDGVWIAGGSVNLDDAIRVLELDNLAGEDHPDYHTLAGFILSIAEEIPRPGARFVYGDYEFKILDMDGNRIDRVQITRLEKTQKPLAKVP
ncbi:MAG: hemolysin family protein [Treponema sp.]|jgi:putative hemolysin|nr:hemolysin family protein [Treponema sp.]